MSRRWLAASVVFLDRSRSAADESGYGRMVAWFRGWGALVRIGVEGCGSYGAGLARYLTAAGIEVVEANRPNRQLRRQKGGKPDSVDAEATSRAAASAEARAFPKSGDGPVECIVASRRSASHPSPMRRKGK